MTTSTALQELARQVRRGTIEILLAAEPDWLTYAPPETSNHILWHAGHALWLQEVLCIIPLTGRSGLPADWADTFGMNCRPVAQTSDWPARDDMQQLLEAQLRVMQKVLGATSEERLAQVAAPERGPATLRDRIIHGLHDEAKHSGEMYLLWKLCRAAGEQ